MPKKGRLIFCANPVQPDVAKPGRLVHDRENPQNYFEPTDLSGPEQRQPKISISEISNVSEFEKMFKSDAFRLTITTIVSFKFGIGSKAVSSIDAKKAQRHQLIQADNWLDNICFSRDTREWLERQISESNRKVWLITDVLILHDAAIKHADQGSHSASADVDVGTAMQSPSLDIGASTERNQSHKVGMKFQGDMVFAARYSRVKLVKHQRSRAKFELYDKPVWTLFEVRGDDDDESGGGFDTGSDHESNSDDEDPDNGARLDVAAGKLEEDEVFEAILVDDSDDE